MATRKTDAAAKKPTAATGDTRKTPAKSAASGAVTGTAKQGRAAKKSAATMRAKKSATKDRKVSAPKAKGASVAASKAKATRVRIPKVESPQIKTSTAGVPHQLAAVVSVKLPQLDTLRELERVMSGAREVTIREGKESLRISGDTLNAVRAVVAALGSGRPSLLVSDRSETEITSQEAADLLNVSRPHVVKLARTGELPHRMVGNRHRFRLADIEEYEDQCRAERERALAAMIPEGGYATEDF